MGNQLKSKKMKFAAALLATVAARHHHHHHHNVEFVNEEASLEAMSDSQLVTSLESSLHSLSPLRPETIRLPLLPRPLPSRTSRRPSPLESSRDLMMDNHSSRLLER